MSDGWLEAMTEHVGDGFFAKPIVPELLAMTWQGLFRIRGNP